MVNVGFSNMVAYFMRNCTDGELQHNLIPFLFKFFGCVYFMFKNEIYDIRDNSPF